MRGVSGENVDIVALRKRIERMQSEGADISLDHSMGGFAIDNLKGNRRLSPRLPKRELLYWLDGYEAGYETGKRKGKEGW